MASFIHGGSEITTWMGYSFKTKSTKSKSIACKVSAKNVNKNYLSWHWRWYKLWKKKTFCLKMTWGISWILTRVKSLKVWVESLKIFTLMDYFCRKYVMFELKKYRGVVLWKMTYGFKNDIRNLLNFHTSSWK